MSRMRHYLTVLSLVVALAALPTPAAAIYMTGKELSQGCMADGEQDIGYCLGYVAGVIDYHVMLQSLGTAPTIDFCLPDTLPVQEAAVVVLTYLGKSPQNGSFIAAPAVAMALHDSFPCAAIAPRRKKR